MALLAEDKSAEIQSNAAFALSKICSDVGSRVKVAAISGAIERLDVLLSNDVTPDLETKATLVLGKPF